MTNLVGDLIVVISIRFNYSVDRREGFGTTNFQKRHYQGGLKGNTDLTKVIKQAIIGQAYQN